MYRTAASIHALDGSVVNMTQPIVGVADLTFNNYVDMNRIDSADDKGDLQEQTESFLTITVRDEQLINELIHCSIYSVKKY